MAVRTRFEDYSVAADVAAALERTHSDSYRIHSLEQLEVEEAAEPKKKSTVSRTTCSRNSAALRLSNTDFAAVVSSSFQEVEVVEVV